MHLGCRPEAGGKKVVVFWAMGAEGENVQKLIPEFERRNPDIHVRLQAIPWTAAHEKLLTAYAGRSTPDIAQLGNTWIPEFTILNALVDVRPWIDRSSEVKKENYFPGIWETNVIDGTIYGIPWYVDTRLLFYRTDLLRQAGYDHAPRTWSEWFDASKKVRARASDTSHYAILLPTNNEWAPAVVMGLEKNSTLLRDGDRYGDFSGPTFTAAFTDFNNFFLNNWAPRKTQQIINVYDAFAEGIFAMYITGPWNIGEFLKRLPASMQGNWMTAPMPSADSTYPGVSLAGGSSLVLFRASNVKDESWKLIEYLSEADRQAEFYKITGDLPAVRESWRDSSISSNKYIQAFYRQLERVAATPKIPEWEQIAQKVREYSEIVALDRMSVHDALAALDRDVNVILEKRRWMLDHEGK
jgi:multiple sugar transport system substrate-binding protein